MAGIVTSRTNCAGGGHHTLTVTDGSDVVSLEIHDNDALEPLTGAEKILLYRLLTRRLRQSGVSLSTFLNRVLRGDEATNMKPYQFFGPGAAFSRSNIGATPVNLLPGVGGEWIAVDLTGVTQFRLVLHAQIVNGVWGARVVRQSDDAVLFTSSNLGAAGERELDTDWQNLPAEFQGQTAAMLRVQIASGASASAVFRSLGLGLR